MTLSFKVFQRYYFCPIGLLVTVRWLILCGFIGLSLTSTIAANRVALVIGNNDYHDLPASMQLTSPVHDAQDVAAALSALGYSVVGGQAVMNAGREQITTATEAFASAAKGAEAAVFYFSGHGIQVGEDNYLLPSDTPKLTGLAMLKNRAVLLRDSIMVALEESGVKTKVIVLDCCRDNPFSAQLETALAQVGKSIKTKSVQGISGYGPEFYLAFATSPGQTAADGNGARNSPFTAALLKTLPEGSGMDIDFFFRKVKALLPEDQVSWTNHSITGTFNLVPEKIASVDQTMVASPVVAQAAPLAAVDSPPSMPPAEPDLPPQGFFSLNDLFATSPYSGWTSAQKTIVLKLAQEKLKAQGHYQGNPDGIPGGQTQRALISFQRAGENKEVSGRFDASCLAQLGLLGMAPPQTQAATVSNPDRRKPVNSTKPSSTSTSRGGRGDMSESEFLRRARALELR